jgi:hypothetical protein
MYFSRSAHTIQELKCPSKNQRHQWEVCSKKNYGNIEKKFNVGGGAPYNSQVGSYIQRDLWVWISVLSVHYWWKTRDEEFWFNVSSYHLLGRFLFIFFTHNRFLLRSGFWDFFPHKEWYSLITANKCIDNQSDN